MAIRVQVPGHGIIEFPDGTTEEQMKAALLKLPQPAAPPPASPAAPERTWTDAAVDALPAIGGTVGGLVGAAGGTVAGVGVGGVPGAVGGATLGGAFGESVRQGVNRLRGKEAPGTVADAATAIGAQGAIQGGAEAIGAGIIKGVSTAGTAVYRGYLKPSLAGANLAKAREIVETGIREWLPVTQAGEAKADRLIKEINNQVTAMLRNTTAKVDLHQVAERVRRFARARYYRPGAPPVDYEAAMKVADQIDNHPSLGIPQGATTKRVDVSASNANEVKTSLDRAIGETGFGVERNAATEARKMGRHAARKAIERVEPGVGPLNKRESELIDALDAITKATGREENKNLLTGWSTLASIGVGGGSGYAASQDPTAAIISAALARGLITPTVATRAGMLAAKFGKVPGTLPATAVRMGVVLATRESEKSAQQH